ncbi:tyrosine-protein phosphatase non-receptor type 18 isoform X2 [Thalassophryne amazonica]|uniref:tyrosine-protein phosphatase non-receptor type 18 isoform X2 n=1 Tax=Thalassophryne amazonica TaxID=390379 RepID=UPI0014725A62|nr:tyrosine-protein phosphatase non-receptor type 18 isoform X2 [Thalassophryne amazonica]
MDLLPSLLDGLRTLNPRDVDQEYSVLHSQTCALKRDLALTCEAGALKENVKKNRYKDILPYDQTRVVLSLITTNSDSDYINASFIQGATADRRYIAAQAPLSSTLTDFFRMIWQHDIKVIVMACREVEMGKKKSKCYWAPLHLSASFGPFTVYNQGETHPNDDVVVRTLTVTYQQVSRTVVQYQFLSWPDHDVPSETTVVLDLLERVRTSRLAQASPLLIHCSAGCGRTGVICALDYIYDLLVTKQITADFSIMKIVLHLRMQRPSAVQTKVQYSFIFSAVVCMFLAVQQGACSQLYCNVFELKKPGKKTADPSSRTRALKLPDMNDTYAVVNKKKQPHPSAANSAHSEGATQRLADEGSSTTSSHLYDNDCMGAPAVPVYSTVRPRVKPSSSYSMAAPNPRLSQGPPSLCNSADYHLVSAQQLSSTDDYEDFSMTDTPTPNSPGGIESVHWRRIFLVAMYGGHNGGVVLALQHVSPSFGD